jgi:small subunit ribosomal protein S6
MRDYELMVVMHPTISDEQMPGALDPIAGYIMTRGGTIQEVQMEAPWGRRRLAYPINDQTEGFYTLFKFQLEPSRSAEVDRDLKLNEDILRFLITRPHPEPQARQEATPAAADGGDAAPVAPAAPSTTAEV